MITLILLTGFGNCLHQVVSFPKTLRVCLPAEASLINYDVSGVHEISSNYYRANPPPTASPPEL